MVNSPAYGKSFRKGNPLQTNLAEFLLEEGAAFRQQVLVRLRMAARAGTASILDAGLRRGGMGMAVDAVNDAEHDLGGAFDPRGELSGTDLFDDWMAGGTGRGAPRMMVAIGAIQGFESPADVGPRPVAKRTVAVGFMHGMNEGYLQADRDKAGSRGGREIEALLVASPAVPAILMVAFRAIAARGGGSLRIVPVAHGAGKPGPDMDAVIEQGIGGGGADCFLVMADAAVQTQGRIRRMVTDSAGKLFRKGHGTSRVSNWIGGHGTVLKMSPYLSVKSGARFSS